MFELPTLDEATFSEFLERRAARGAIPCRLISWFGLGIYLLYAGVDAWLDPHPQLGKSLFLRVLGGILTAMHIHSLPAKPSPRELDLYVHRHLVLVTLFTTCLIALRPDGSYLGLPGLMQLFTLGCALFVQSRQIPWQFLTVLLSSWVGAVVGLSPRLVVAHALCLSLGVLLGWLAATRSEASARRELLMEKELEREARTDGLTGVLNRRAISELGHRELESGRGLSVILMDIDHFKQINDTRGHDVGDLALQGVARRCSELSRPHGVLARWGGEEFLIVAPALLATEAHLLAERLRATVAQMQEPVPVTISLGVAWANASSWHELLKRADEALYEAKRLGRNRTVVS